MAAQTHRTVHHSLRRRASVFAGVQTAEHGQLGDVGTNDGDQAIPLTAAAPPAIGDGRGQSCGRAGRGADGGGHQVEGRRHSTWWSGRNVSVNVPLTFLDTFNVAECRRRGGNVSDLSRGHATRVSPRPRSPLQAGGHRGHPRTGGVRVRGGPERLHGRGRDNE